MKKPFVLINSAIAADGKLSTKERKPIQISSKEDKERVRELRKRFDGIMVGIGTVLADNPTLGKNIVKIVADSKAKTPLNSDVLSESNETIIAVSKKADQQKIEKLKNKARIITCGEEKVDLSKLMPKLYELGVEKLIVEGGGTLNWSFLKENLVDRLYTYVGNMVFGGENAPTLVDGDGVASKKESNRLELIGHEKLGEGVLIKWKVR